MGRNDMGADRSGDRGGAEKKDCCKSGRCFENGDAGEKYTLAVATDVQLKNERGERSRTWFRVKTNFI